MDKFRKGKSNFATTLVTGIGTGTSETITLNSTAGLPTDTEIVLTFNRVTSSGVVNPTSLVERIRGKISGSTLTSYTRGVDSTTEQAHGASTVVEYIPNAEDMNDLIDGILVEHNQDGTHDTTKVVDLSTAQTLTNKTIDGDTNTLQDIAPTSIKTTVLGYAEITSDFSTATSGSYVDVTNLAVTVTVPAGGKQVKITAYARQCGDGGGINEAGIFEGTTQLQTSNQILSTVNFPIIWVGTPSAGSHTYKVAIKQAATGTIFLRCAEWAPAFILVELM